MTTISRITQDDEGCYTWEVTREAWDNRACDFAEQTIAYRTDKNGRGLWVWARSPSTWYADGSPVMEWRQVFGTAQFNLNGSQRTRRNRVARYFASLE